jgi:hypothetical protein
MVKKKKKIGERGGEERCRHLEDPFPRVYNIILNIANMFLKSCCESMFAI